MNDCEQAFLLNACLDGEMTPQDRDLFERHLRQCPQCAADLERLRKLAEAIGTAARTRPAMPPEAIARLHRSIDRLPSAGVVRLAEKLAAVAAMILMACSVSLLRQSPAQAAASGAPAWEAESAAQLASEPAAAGSEELLARWMVQDLSRKGAHE